MGGEGGEAGPPASPWHSRYVWFLLALANVGFGSMGPIFLLIKDEANIGTLTAASWRGHLLLILLLPISLIEYLRSHAKERFSFLPLHGLSVFAHVMERC